jgi:hypothetical protein
MSKLYFSMGTVSIGVDGKFTADLSISSYEHRPLDLKSSYIEECP